MKIGDRIRISIAEPWDFKSSKGDNILSITVCDHKTTKYGDTYLVRSNETFDIKSLRVRFMVMTHRHNTCDSTSHFNIAYIPDEMVLTFHSITDMENMEKNLVPIILGSLEAQ